MQVMQPYPAVVNPSLSRYSLTPEASKYLVTTPDPGDRDVQMYGFVARPFSTAFFAKRPA